MKTLSCAARVLRPYLIAAISLAALGTIHAFFSPGKLKGDPYGSQRLHPQPPFRYAIIYNDPGTDGSSRTLIILMEPSEFSEANLRTLFGLLSRRYKNLPKYNAYIETSLEDVPTPEEHEGPAIQSKWAILTRARLQPPQSGTPLKRTNFISTYRLELLNIQRRSIFVRAAQSQTTKSGSPCP
jgi:hypothetical protein